MKLFSFKALIAVIALLAPQNAWAQPLYEDGTWGVVPQDGGRTCVVVLNSQDKKHAFHFLIDGEQNAATVGILDNFLPDARYGTASTMVTLNFGSKFARRFEFKRRFDGALHYLAAELRADDLEPILEILRSGRAGVSLSFENGETWRIPPPKREEAGSAIARCWSEALRGLHTERGERSSLRLTAHR
jgi:hypothetical protein